MVRKMVFGATGLAVVIAACGDVPSLDPKAGIGPNPTLPDPHYFLVAPIKLSPPVGWGRGETPRPAPGLAVTRFADGLAHPRWLHVLPNGDVLVAEADGPGEVLKRPKDLVMRLAMRRVKAEGIATPMRISLLRDADGNGVAETKSLFIDNLKSPFGMALVGDQLYVANTDALARFPYREGDTAIRAPGVKVADLPAGPINHHWTKNVTASRDGSKLYVTVGSNSNVGENGTENEVERAAILEIDPSTGGRRVFASGLRNPNGMDWEPRTGMLWTVVNERDEIGDDLVPDYITSVTPGGFYGWPYSYSASISTSGPIRGGRTSSPRRSSPIMPSARTQAPSASLSPMPTRLVRPIAKGPSSVSTVRGIGHGGLATRSSSFPFRAANPAACRSTS